MESRRFGTRYPKRRWYDAGQASAKFLTRPSLSIDNSTAAIQKWNIQLHRSKTLQYTRPGNGDLFFERRKSRWVL